MANPRHLEILQKGVPEWNRWRAEHKGRYGNLTRTDLSRLNLRGINFVYTKLHDSNLSRSNLSQADLLGADFRGANLDSANLTFCEARLADFSEASMRKSRLGFTQFFANNFSNVDLTFAQISDARMVRVRFDYANFDCATLSGAVFSECSFKDAKNLDKIVHKTGSSIDLNTILLSEDNLPEKFLKGLGLSEVFLTYAKSFKADPIEFYSCFISFTEADDVFSERLYNDMLAAGVRCWRWKENAKWGNTLRKEIDQAVKYYDKLVVICSKDSLNAPAVQEEIELALNKEAQQIRDGQAGEILFPIRVDDYIFQWKHYLQPRLARKNIGDFRNWSGNPQNYRKMVKRLIADLTRRPNAR